MIFQLSPITSEAGGLGIDMLPPSPSAISPSHRLYTPSPSNLSSSTISDANTVVGAGEGKSGDDTSRGQDFTPFQSPGFAGPMIRPLDYTLLASSEAVHGELARTVADLSQWLEVIDYGLSNVLDPPSDVSEDSRDQNSYETSGIRSES